MKVLFAIIISTLSLTGTSYCQQIGFKDIDESQLSPWTPHIDLEYQGTYHFGDSELESSLVIVITTEGSYAQIRSKTWSLTTNDWYYEFRNLDSVQIIDNRFFSSQTNGAFMIYSQNNQMIRTLKIDSPWSEVIEPGHYELGYRYGSLKRYYSGDYIEGSTQILTTRELEKLSFNELTLLKNEIYARYGLVFHDRSLRKHFRQKGWYKEKYKSVDKFLTQLEKNNIINIEIVESQTSRSN
ncbi:YARHG domain-containing protein [Fulvivirga sediminis]|uniref:YARHG domain-containing protein n=1 Tax=Fulvivirga sediminis TaxID=2803949 RepID=A0A937FDG9_9BACT|nr:YARHG domain-containing protein [Fulvivirga sediminis]MBL3658528.1 YARHG domain-containing protein [Fulvivirga sediminis]